MFAYIVIYDYICRVINLNTKIMKLTKSQKFVCLKVKQQKNIFIQGVAGTGKTYLLKKIEEITGRPVMLFATSGLASVNLGGSTISSYNGLCLGMYDKTKEEIKELNSYKWYLNTIIVIDEVGFLSEEQFNQIDYALRCRGNRNEFCGGFQVILAGDFRQMPHIGWGKSLEKSEILNQFQKIELIENVRQSEDVPFFKILNKVRGNGFTNEVKNFICENQNTEINEGIQIVATRQLMDELNNKLTPPKDAVVYKYECDPFHTERLYDEIKLWEGMPVIITRNNNSKGYYNGDTGIITKIDENDKEVLVRLDRTSEEVWVSFQDEKYLSQEKKELFITSIFENYFETDYYKCYNFNCLITNKEHLLLNKKNKVVLIKTNYYDYMPILPANYLSIRRCQGLTLTKGILHESILNADLYNSKDRVNIQYVALSRFEKINQVHVKGFEKQKKELKINKKITLKIA